jgi:hypothetical protein
MADYDCKVAAAIRSLFPSWSEEHARSCYFIVDPETTENPEEYYMAVPDDNDIAENALHLYKRFYQRQDSFLLHHYK